MENKFKQMKQILNGVLFNLFKLMKLSALTCIVIAAMGGTLLARPAYTQSITAVKTSVNMKSISRDKVLQQLQQSTGFNFMYNKALIGGNTIISLHLENESVKKILDRLFQNTNVGYRQVEEDIYLYEKRVAQQPGRISGKIVDEKGEGMPGANIKVTTGGKGVQSNVDGTYSLELPAGTYTLEISYLSYQTQRITNVIVTIGKNTPLDIAMKGAANALSEVVVTSGYKKASIAGLYAQQQNTAEISNGISAEQIAATPDKNVGDVLKRIAGVSTNDNRRVVIRGIAERYNVAMLDGVTLPSTDVQVRDFEFDIIPSNLIDNVVVSKGFTPDMSFGFGGGLVQISTLTIPNKDFITFNFGSKYNDASTGKDFLGYQRGKSDYFAFDDGGRKDHFPKDLFFYSTDRYSPGRPYDDVTPPGSGMTPITPAMIAEQNKKIGGTERLGTRIYTARPSQNFQFSLGESYHAGKGRLGFVGSLSYRNEQMIDDISHFERGVWAKNTANSYDAITGKEIHETGSKQYNFNTNWAALLNGGWEMGNHKLFTRNFYSRSLQSRFIRISGWGNDIGFGDNPAVTENDSPKFIELLQTKLSGEHRFGQLLLDWNVARNKISNNEYDAVEASLVPEGTANGIVYSYFPNSVTDPGVGVFNRAQYLYDEDNLMADIAASYLVKIGKQNQKIKAGYQYLKRHGKYDWNILPVGSLNGARYRGIPVQEWSKYFEFNDPLNDIFYYPGSFSLNGYEGKNTNAAFFGMVDNRIFSWMRLVWGIRAESYVYEEIKDANSGISQHLDEQAEAKRRYVDPATGQLVHKYLDAATEEQKWRYLPSVNMTLTPFKDFNIRGSYAQSVVRPSLIENSGFSRLNPTIGRIQHNVGVLSTIIDHYDSKIEWYPAPGEVLSVGYFYKYFKNPVELYLDITNSSQSIDAITGNSDWAKVRGWEFDFRKSLSFLYAGWKPLANMFVSANLTLQNSEVQASRFNYTSFGEGTYDKEGLSYAYREKVLLKEKRPLYGQVPVLYNLGLLYSGDRLSLNVVYNHMGYKTFTVGMMPEFVEYERPRNQLDAQIGYAFLKNKGLKMKLNLSNLSDNPYRFYVNNGTTYKVKPNATPGLLEWSDRYEWKYGFSEKYEEGYYETSEDGKTKMRIGDTDTFTRKIGRSMSLSLSYSF
ncbi:outer membrane receptor protein involved in Fe transport [Pedobacter metabolipauper]|uniref:Outer membrane receptor protein involved in Fe transport n=2 Tax=Pedobacter metabolipauper TaxID=425513 RepID=A0A4R6SU21_9SPHI|nr:outer membrane receptor protein involved in Fe transport [Pedobacter metabolipauper]